MMKVLKDMPVDLDMDSLTRRVRLEPRSESAAEFEALVRRARDMARPKAVYAESFVEARGENTVRIDGVTFASAMLRANLDRIERVFPYVATCGREMDEADLSEGDFLQEYWWDTIKGAVLACATKHLNDHLQNRFRLGKTAKMNPGSGDADVWPIEQQRELFALLGDVRGLIGVELTPSCLMLPNKTTSGVIFQAETDFRSCQVCRRENCPGRSAPFEKEMWDSIHHP